MEIISARDLSRYLKINEKKIYKLVQESVIPHIKIGGKIAFTKELIDTWILENTEHQKQIFIAGSDDPMIRRVIDLFNAGRSGVVFYAPVGSIKGLKILKENAATMSCVHILDLEKKAYTLSYIERYLSRNQFTALQLFVRDQGLFVKKGNPKGITSLKGLTNQDLRFVNRGEGSGTRLLLDFLLREEAVDASLINGYKNEVQSHLEAGLSVLSGAADCSFGIRYIANLLDLDFVPLFKERFDMVIPEHHFHSVQVRDFLNFFEQPYLLNHIKDFTGYDLSGTGSVLQP